MNWTRSSRRLANIYKSSADDSKFASSLYYSMKVCHQDVIFSARKFRFFSGLQCQIGCLPVTPMGLMPKGSGIGAKGFKFPGCFEGNSLPLSKNKMVQFRQFGRAVENDPSLDRNFFVKLWVADKKMKDSARKRRRTVANYRHGALTVDDQSPYLNSLGRLFSGASVTEENSSATGRQVLKQPPLTQSITGFLEPESPEEVRSS